MKRGWKALTAAALACCMILGGCGGKKAVDENGQNGQGGQNVQSGEYKEAEKLSGRGSDAAVLEVPQDALDDTLMKTTNQFAYKLAGELTKNGENYFFSPYSICSALAVLDNAANGETKAQIEALLGITDLNHYNRQMASYLHLPQDEKASLSTANSIWLQKGYPFADTAYDKYLPLVETFYGAEIWQADFANDPSGMKDQVNQWISEHTGGMIPKFRTQDYERDTRVSIINAVYFYGEWSIPFHACDTYDQTFHGKSGESKVPMMHKDDVSYSYYTKDGLRGLCLQYGGGGKAMNILIPAEGSGKTAAELFAALDDEAKDQFLTSLMASPRTTVDRLAMPKFNMEYSVPEMAEMMKSLGMTEAFMPQADFGQLVDKAVSEFYVSDINHKAKLEVDELGSRASAVTEILKTDGCALMEYEPLYFIVDQPFLFFIQDQETGMILFMGEVNDL